MKHTFQPDDSVQPGLAWLLTSGAGAALAAVVVAGVLAGRTGIAISGPLLLGAALLGTLPQLVALVRGRWALRGPELAATLLALIAVGGVGLALAWPSLLPLGLSVDAVHHYQLVSWIADRGTLPPLDGEMRGLMGEMIAYPPGLALVVVAGATLAGHPALDVLYPTVALVGGLNAALVVLLAAAGSAVRVRWRKLPLLLVGVLLLLAHRVYTLDAYTDQSYYAMTLGVTLLLLASGWLIVEPRPTRAGMAQLGLALAALVGVYPLWVVIPGALALLTIGLGAESWPRKLVFGALGLSPALVLALLDLPARLGVGQTVLEHQGVVAMPTLQNLAPILLALLLGAAYYRIGLRNGLVSSTGKTNDERRRTKDRVDSPFAVRHSSFVGPQPTQAGFATVAVGLTRQSIPWPNPTPAVERTPLVPAIPASTTTDPSTADRGGRQLLGLVLLTIVLLLALLLAARLGRAASYHSYKLLFVLTPLAAAITGAAALRLGAITRPWPRRLALAAMTLLLIASGSFRVVPPPALQALTPDMVAAAQWLKQHSPRDARKAIVIGAPAGPQTYWLQVGLLGQRRDKAELAMRAFTSPATTPEAWIIDTELPKTAILAQGTPPPGAITLARFGQAAVLQRKPDFDVTSLDPLLIRYRIGQQGQQLNTQIELLQRQPGRTPLVELRLMQGGAQIATFPLQPDQQRTRTQYLGLELQPTLGGSGYINRDAFPAFAPPAAAPTGSLSLTLRLVLNGALLDERLLATFDRASDGQLQQLSASDGELVYLRREDATGELHSGEARFTDSLLLSGWSQPAWLADDHAVAVDLRWQATRPIARSLYTEIEVLDEGGRGVAHTIALPQQGFYPTWRWRPGEDVADRHQVVLPTDLAPGIYHLRISLRDFGAQGQPLVGGAAQLGQFTVE